MIKLHRIFNGKRYEFYGEYSTVGQADEAKRNMEGTGWMVRKTRDRASEKFPHVPDGSHIVWVRRKAHPYS